MNHTVQFWKQDVSFFKRGSFLTHATMLGEIKKLDGVCLYLEN